jgi:hypothetical protein
VKVPLPPVGVEPVITSGLPVPQKVVVEGAVKVLEAMVAVTVTACVLVNVVVQLTGDIFNALTLIVALADNVAVVSVRLALAPSFDDPVDDAPLYSW